MLVLVPWFDVLATLLQVDCYDGVDGQPRVYHGGTLSNKVRFEDIIRIVKDFAFVTSEYPLILTCELHCTASQQQVMANILKKHLSGKLSRPSSNLSWTW